MLKRKLIFCMFFVLIVLSCMSYSFATDSNDNYTIKDDSSNDFNTNSNYQRGSSIGYDDKINLNLTFEDEKKLAKISPVIDLYYKNGTKIKNLNVLKNNKTKLYELNFQSDSKEYIISAKAKGFIPKNISINTAETLNAKLSLKRYTVLVLTGSSVSNTYSDSYNELYDKAYYYKLHFYDVAVLNELTDSQKSEMKNLANKANLIIIEMTSDPVKLNILDYILSDTKNTSIALRCGDSAIIPYTKTLPSSSLESSYWSQGGVENFKRFQLYSLNKYAGMEINPKENLSLITLPKYWIYHPDADNPVMLTFNEYLNWYKSAGLYKKNAPWIGIIGLSSYYTQGNYESEISLLKSLESKGVNGILTFANGAKGRENVATKIFTSDGKSNIDVLITRAGFNFVGKTANLTADENNLKILSELNVPVIATVYGSAKDLNTWKNSSNSFLSEIYWQVAQPEMDGRIEPIFVGAKMNLGVDPISGITLEKLLALDDRIDRISSRAINWANLRYLNNSEKNIALVYYNIDGGKDGVAASYLDVVGSVNGILDSMKKNGYVVDGDYSYENIINIMTGVGNNIGSWAPGELEKIVKLSPIMISLSDYNEFFRTLPKKLQDDVVKSWGTAPGNVMVYNNSFVIPGVMMGNVFLGPQPMRGWGEDPEKIRHSSTLAPSHQYIAFYYYIQKNFDAIIHLGTHGTLEWLPGRNIALGSDDWSDALIGNVPNINPYIIENTGEGTQAKRRGYAVIIEHNIPVMLNSGLYGDLAELKNLLNEYQIATDSSRKATLRLSIINSSKNLGLDKSLGLDFNGDFNTALNEIDHSLEDMESSLIPYGLHVFAKNFNETELDAMVESIVSYNPEERNNSEFKAKIRSKLVNSYEMTNLLKALNGEFIPADVGGNSIKYPDIMPPGSNFYSFDPRTAPDEASWEVGKKLADGLIDNYYKKNGKYPEQVGVVLWSTETMRTHGQSIALLLRLAGLEPIWKNGKFSGAKVTPLDELNRPRIDVLVSISGLFRDHFSYTIDYIDDSLRLAMSLDEDPNKNYLRKHYLEQFNKYKDSGISDNDSDLYSSARIFGSSDEGYGTGISSQVTTPSAWDNQEDLVETYMNKNSYVYGRDKFAVISKDSLINNLKNVDITFQVRDGLYGVLDNDDVYQYLGALTMASKYYSGNVVEIFIGNTRTNNPKVETFSKFLADEMHTRLLNPKWAEGMLNSGFSGAHEITDHVENLFGWSAVSPESVENWMWSDVSNTYLLNSEMRSKLLAANPHAYHSMNAWAIESAIRGMWKPSNAVLSQLMKNYIEDTVNYGVTCCHHTCSNFKLDNYVISSSGLSPELLNQYADVLEKATNHKLNTPSVDPVSPVKPADPLSHENPNQESNQNPSDNQESNSEHIEAATAGSSNEINQKQDDTGNVKDSQGESKDAYEINKESPSSTSQGISPWAIVGVILILTLFVGGYLAENRRKEK